MTRLLAILFALPCAAAVYLDFGTALQPPVLEPFTGIHQPAPPAHRGDTQPAPVRWALPPLSYTAILRSDRGDYYPATAISKDWAVTATHVAGRVGDRYTARVGTNVYRVTERRDLSYQFGGLTFGSDVTLLRFDRLIPVWVPVSTNTPATGAEVISVGAGSWNHPSSARVTKSQFNWRTKQWTTHTNVALISGLYNGSDGKARWWRTRFIQSNDLFRTGTPAELASQNKMTGYMLMPEEHGKGYGLAGKLDSGAPCFVLRPATSAQAAHWELICVVSQSSPAVAADSSWQSGTLLSGVLDQVTAAIKP